MKGRIVQTYFFLVLKLCKKYMITMLLAMARVG